MKTKAILLSIATLIFINLSTSNIFSHSFNDQDYLTFAEQMPELIGGIESIAKKVAYPEMASKMQIEGKVYIMAYIDENGKVNDAKVIKDIGGGCGDEAARAVMGAKFKPGKNKSVPVKVKMPLAIDFKLK